jgi:integrase
MKKNGRAEITIKMTVNRLTRVSHLCNIFNPEEVKATLANADWMNSSKRNVAEMINTFYNYLGIQWKMPKYTRESNMPFIPTEEEINALITTAQRKYATLIQTLKETGARIGEIDFLQWTHIDLERKTIYITPEKGSNARILPISNTLINMLNELPRKTIKVFEGHTHQYQTAFDKIKRRAAKRLNNPRLLKIHPHTLRHWKGTTEYHKTKDIIHVQQVLGHKDIKQTLVYINLENALYNYTSDEYICKIAETPEQAIKLIEAGFEHVTNYGEKQLFKKRK